jgi:hypothetical protein
LSDFPASPLAPSEFLEGWLPHAFAAIGLPDEVKAVELELGVLLEGQGGGEWIFQLLGGELAVQPGSRASAAFTLVQSVEDWRGALWEGRGGAIGKGASTVFRPTSLAGVETASGGVLKLPGPAALAQMRALDGLLSLVVSGGAGSDWGVGFKLGPGDIPPEPNTKVTFTEEDAAALERGELDPLEAFMAGRIQVDGDVALLMQMQAAAMSGA